MGFEPPTDADDDLNAFYQGLGAISSLHSGAITPSDLSDVDRLVVMLPDDAFAPAEIAAIGDFVASGGDLLVMGDQQGFSSVENGFVNGLLAGLGSAMSLGSDSIDAGFLDTLSGQILLQPGLTDGVGVINHGNTNSISGFDPAQRLFLASNLMSVWGSGSVALDGPRIGPS